jgi:RHS repeat-associated protein
MPKVTAGGGKEVAKTGSRAAANVVGGMGPSQTTNVLVRAGGLGLSNAGVKKKQAKASPKNDKAKGDPVSVVSGQVVRGAIDLGLGGPIPVAFRRSYTSAMHDETSSLGRGGWTHALEQWVAMVDDELTLRGDDGKNLALPAVAPNETGFHRGRRLSIKRVGSERWEIESLDARTTRTFEPLEKGGRAVLREIRDRWSNRVELAYAAGRLVAVKAFGRELRLAHDPDGRILRVEAWAEGSARQAVAFAYTREGELARATDALGHHESYRYDALHRLVATTLKNGVNFRYAYDDDLGRCVRTWGEGRHVSGSAAWPTDGTLHDVEFTYDTKAKTTVAADHEVRKFTWNDAGALVREETPDGDFAIEYAYDDDLLVVGKKNAADEKWGYEYDARGNKISETDPAGNVTRWDYKNDAVVRRVSPEGYVTEFTQNAQGSPIGVKAPTGLRYQIAYDGAGRVSYVSGEDGTIAAFEYDEKHDLVRETDARGARTTFTYDPLGRPLTRTDALGRTTKVAYDALGRPIQIERHDSTRIALAYDAMGNVVRRVDPMGRTTTREFAGTGVLVKEIGPDGQAWQFAYDGNERLSKITNPKHEVWELAYDRAGRVVEERTFDERVLRYGYSRADRLQRVEYPDETWRAFVYDPLGNVVVEDSSHGQETYARDKLGRLLEATVTEHAGKTVVKLERDRFGRIVGETQNGHAVRSTWDARSRRTARELPGGETTRYAYDRPGAIAKIEHGGQTLAFTRDALGRETKLAAAKGKVEIESAWDAMDQLETRVARAPSRSGEEALRVLSQRAWTYDANGRVKEATDARWGTARYAYDAIGEILEAHRGARHDVFQYDGGGSLVAAFEGLSDAKGRWSVREGGLLAETPGARYAHDARHRRTKKEGTEYLWDCRDRLREVRLPGGARVLYTYDAFGRRVRKETISGDHVRVVQFLWDGNALAQEIDTERGKRVFVHAPGTIVPLLQEEQGETFTYVVDQVGTPKELIDASGRVAWSVAHAAWGQVTETYREEGTRAIESPFRLLGHYHDDETGLSYARHRYFDPDTVRWLSPDPLGIVGGPNVFAFDGAPTNDTDPFGLCKEGKPKELPRPDEPSKGTRQSYDKQSGQGIYVLVDENGTVKYVGRGDAPTRGLTHASDPDKAELGQQIVFDNNLTKAQAKGIEQRLMDHFGGPSSTNEDTPLLNQIKSYRDTNPNSPSYRAAISVEQFDDTLQRMSAMGIDTTPWKG